MLDRPPDGHAEPMRELVAAERMTRLSGASGSQTVRELLVRVRPDVVQPVDLTPEVLPAGTRPLARVVHDGDGPPHLVAVAVFFETGAHDHPEPGDTVREVVAELPADTHTAGVPTVPGEHQRLTGCGRRVALTGIRARAMQGVDR